MPLSQIVLFGLTILVLAALTAVVLQARRRGRALSDLSAKVGRLKEKMGRANEAAKLMKSDVRKMKRQLEQFPGIAGSSASEQRKYDPGFTMVVSLPSCGGNTLRSTLDAFFLHRMEIKHQHVLSEEGLGDAWRNARQYFADQHGGQDLPEQQNAVHLNHAHTAKALRQMLEADDCPKVRLFGGVREPIALMVSAFFHRRDVLGFSNGADLEQDPGTITKIMDTIFTRDHFDHWFEREIRGVIGIDVLSAGFDIKKGYQVYHNGKVEYGLIRVDRMGQLPVMLEEAFGVPAAIVSVQSENKAEDKRYAETYKKALAQLRFPEEFVQYAYSTRYSRTFWTPEELAGYARKWTSQQENS